MILYLARNDRDAMDRKRNASAIDESRGGRDNWIFQRAWNFGSVESFLDETRPEMSAARTRNNNNSSRKDSALDFDLIFK